MTNDEIKDELSKVIEGTDILTVLKVDHVNHKPHPFTIGPKHITHAADHCGGILDERTLKEIPCAMNWCNLLYDEHTSDKVCFLQLKRSVNTDELQPVMLMMQSIIERNQVDGFVFVDTQEKYRISK